MEQELLDQDGKAIKEPKPKKRWLKRIVIFVGVVVILLAVFIALLPTLLSTGPGTRFALGFVNSSIPGEIAVDDLSVGWFSATSVSGVKLDDPDGKTVGTIASIDLPNTSLFSLATLNLADIELTIQKPDLTITTGKEGERTNLERALVADSTAGKEAKPEASPKSRDGEGAADIRWPDGLAFKVLVSDSSVSFSAPNVETVKATAETISFDASNFNDLKAVILARVEHGKDSGRVNVNADVKQLFDASGVLSISTAKFNVTADINNVPMTVADQLMKTEGKIQAVIGPTFNAGAKLVGELKNLQASTNVDCKQLRVQGSVVLNENGIEVKEAPEVHWRLTTRASSMLFPQMKVAEPVTVDVTVPKLALPAQEQGKFNLAKLAAEINLAVSDINVNVKPIGDMKVSGTKFHVMTEELASQIKVTGNSDITPRKQAPGRFELEAVASKLLDADSAFSKSTAALKFDANVSNVAVALADQFMKLDTLLTDALGSTVNLTVNGNLKELDKNGVGLATIKVDTAKLEVQTTADIQADLISVRPGRLVSYRLTPEAVASLLPKDDQGKPTMALAQSSRIEAFIDKLTVPRDGMGVNLPMTEVGLRATVDQLQVKGIEKIERLQLKNIVMTVPKTSLATPVAADITAGLHDRGSEAGTVKVSASAFVPGIAKDAPEMPLESASVRLSNIATALIESLAGMKDEEITTAMGSSFELVEVTVKPGKPAGNETQRYQISTTLADRDPLLDAKVDAIVGIKPDAYALMLAQPSTIGMRLQPVTFQAFMTKFASKDGQSSSTKPWTLKNTPQLKLQVDKLSADVPKDMGGNLLTKITAAIDTTATIDQVEIQSPQGPRAFAQNLQFKVQSRELTKQTRLKVTGKAGQAVDATSKPAYADILSDTTVRNYLTADGQVNTRDVEVTTDTQLPSIPIQLIEQFTGDSKLQPVFGEKAEFSLNGTVPGKILMVLDSGNAKSKANMSISKPPRKLTFNQDMIVMVTINKELADTYLKNVHPMFHDVLGATEPTKLTIFNANRETKEPTMIPLHSGVKPTDIVMFGRLDITPLKMNRRGWMTAMFEGIFGGFADGVTKIFAGLGGGKQVNANKLAFGDRQSYTAEFPRPLKFDLKDGFFRTTQFWLSSKDLAIGFKGYSNLNNKTQDFVIGIPGATLLADDPRLFVPLPSSSIFRIAISADTIYNVGVKGPTDGDIASQVNYGALVSQVVSTGIKLNARRIGGNAGSELVGGLAGLVTGIGQKATDTVDPSQKDSALRTVKWDAPEKVKQFMDREADKRKTLMLQENKPDGQGDGKQQQQEEKKQGGAGDLINDLLGG